MKEYSTNIYFSLQSSDELPQKQQKYPLLLKKRQKDFQEVSVYAATAGKAKENTANQIDPERSGKITEPDIVSTCT